MVSRSYVRSLALSIAAAALVGAAAVPAAEPIWHSPVPISAAGDAATDPAIAVDRGGSAIAVWIGGGGGQYEYAIQAAVRPPGRGWTGPETISAPGSVEPPQVAVDGSGNAVAVWSRTATSSDKPTVEVATRAAGGAWGAPAAISDPADATFGAATTPDLAVDFFGDATVVWNAATAPCCRQRVRTASHPAGGAWGAPNTLSADQSIAFHPTVALSPQGHGVAMWSRGFGSPSQIVLEAVERPAGGAWSAPETVFQDDAALAMLADVAMDDAGDAVAAFWRMSGGSTGNEVHGAARPFGEGWSQTTLSAPGENAMGADVAVDPEGNAAVLWQRDANGTQTVRRAERPAGGLWGEPMDASGSGAIAGFPQIAFESHGNALGVFDLGGTVYAAARPAGGAFAPPQPISDAPGSIAPIVDFDDAGNAVAVWQQGTSPSVIEAADYDVEDLPPPPPPPLPPPPLPKPPPGARPQTTPPPTPSDAPGCFSKVEFGPAEALASCFHTKGDTYATSDRARINGIDIEPVGFTDEVVVDPGRFRVRFKGTATIRIGSLVLWNNFVDLDVDVRSTIELSTAGLVVADFPVQGKAAFKLSNKQAQAELTVKLPAEFTGITGAVRVGLDNEHGIRLNGIALSVPHVFLGPFEFAAFTVGYDFEANQWLGFASMTLPTPEPHYSVTAGVVFKGGRLDQALAQVDGLNVPIGKGVFLQRFLASFKTNPLFLKGGIGVSFGPQENGVELISVDGSLSYQFANPGMFRIQGDLSVLRVFDIASAFVQYKSTGALTLGGHITWIWLPDAPFPVIGRVPGVQATGAIHGYVDRDVAALLEGDVTLQLSFLSLSAHAVVSNVGVAVCGTASLDVPVIGPVGVVLGVGYTWSTRTLSVIGGSCDFGPYKPAASQARSATVGATVALAPGLPSTVIAVRGSEVPPKVVLTGPGGESVTTPDALEPLRQGRFLVVQNAADRTTYVVIARPAGGTWRIAPSAGSSPIARVEQAAGLPRPSVTARVTGSKRKRTLRWRLKPIPGQSVRFVEQGRDTARVLGTGRRARGAHPFTPGPGRGGSRRVFAEILQNGLVRERRVVAGFVAPPPPRPPRPRGLRVHRRGTRLVVTFRRARGFRYAVRVRVSDGRMLALMPRRGRVVVGRFNAGETAGVSVVALGELNRAGPAAHARAG